MSINTYHTAFGSFTVVADDDIYDKYKTYSNNTYALAGRSAVTGKWSEKEFGRTFRETFGELMASQFVIAKNSNATPVETKTLSEFKNYVPNIRFVEVNASSTVKNLLYDLIEPAEDNLSRTIRITYNIGENNDDLLELYCSGKVGNGSYNPLVPGEKWPYGKVASGGVAYHITNCFDVCFLVANSDMSRIISISVYSSPSGSLGDDLRITTQLLTLSEPYSSNIVNFLTSVELSGTDPLSPGGQSGPGGGDGTFDFSSTPVDYPGLPTIGAYATGFVNIYVPSASDLRALAAYMWAGAFDIENFRKIVADPMDAIMGLSILPVTASQIGVTSSVLSIGNISTGLTMNHATSQYVAVDCGTVEILPKWGAYLDFAPYSKLQLYLPYIGFVDISLDDVMNGSIGVRYSIDILSGTCIAFVKCKDHVIYEFGGSCACQCPVTEGQYRNGLFGVLDLISGVGQLVSAGASAVPSSSGNTSSASMAANIGGAVVGAVDAIEGMAGTLVSMVKPQIGRSGSVGGSAGLMGYQMPYLVLTVPHMCIPGDQNKYMGYPSFVTMQMAELSGYTEINVTHLNNMSATDTEIAEILSLLSTGVIF